VSDSNDIDRLVQRAVNGITSIAARAARFSTRMLVGTTIVCVSGFALGVAALSGGIESVWIVLGIVFGSIAIGSALVARWRVGSVRRHGSELAAEARTLIAQGGPTGRTVVDVFAVDDDDLVPNENAGSGVVLSRQMYGFRQVSGPGLQDSPRLSAAITALTSFPLLVISAVMISLVFAFLGFIFLIALAL